MLRDPVLKPRFQFDFVLKCTKHSDEGHLKTEKKGFKTTKPVTKFGFVSICIAVVNTRFKCHPQLKSN